MRLIYFRCVGNLYDVVLVTSTAYNFGALTLSKFFKRSIILPSTSCCDRPAGAEYHLDAWMWVDGAMRADLMAIQGAIALDVGNRVRTASLETQRADWTRTGRNIVVVVASSGCCCVRRSS